MGGYRWSYSKGFVEIIGENFDEKDTYETQDEDGRTPIMKILEDTSEKPKIDAVLVLKKMKDVRAGIMLRDKKGYTALHYAARYGHAETEEYILSPDELNGGAKGIHEWRGNNGKTAMYLAIENENKNDADVMLRIRAQILMVNNQDLFGRTPIMNIFIDYPNEAVYLMKHMKALGADITLKDDDGWTALHWAIKTDNKEGIDYILSPDGFDGFAQNIHEIEIENGKTILDIAKEKGWHDILKAFEKFESKQREIMSRLSSLVPLSSEWY